MDPKGVARTLAFSRNPGCHGWLSVPETRQKERGRVSLAATEGGGSRVVAVAPEPVHAVGQTARAGVSGEVWKRGRGVENGMDEHEKSPLDGG